MAIRASSFDGCRVSIESGKSGGSEARRGDEIVWGTIAARRAGEGEGRPPLRWRDTGNSRGVSSPRNLFFALRLRFFSRFAATHLSTFLHRFSSLFFNQSFRHCMRGETAERMVRLNFIVRCSLCKICTSVKQNLLNDKFSTRYTLSLEDILYE